MIVALTGHRPQDLAGGDERSGFDQWTQSSIETTARLAFMECQPSNVITGMAIGWDQRGAQAAFDLGIDVFAVIPFKGQERKWPKGSRDEYRRIITQCSSVHILYPEPYEHWKMHARNEYMVDAAHTVVALWSGKCNGGTYSCIKYAMKQGKEVYNAYPLFEHVVHQQEIDESTLPSLEPVSWNEVFGDGQS